MSTAGWFLSSKLPAPIANLSTPQRELVPVPLPDFPSSLPPSFACFRLDMCLFLMNPGAECYERVPLCLPCCLLLILLHTHSSQTCQLTTSRIFQAPSLNFSAFIKKQHHTCSLLHSFSGTKNSLLLSTVLTSKFKSTWLIGKLLGAGCFLLNMVNILGLFWCLSCFSCNILV